MARSKKEEEDNESDREQQRIEKRNVKIKKAGKKAEMLLPSQEHRLRILQSKKKAKLKILKKIKRRNKQLGKSSELKPVRVDFTPFQLLQTGIFVHITEDYTQLSMKPLYMGREYFAINNIPCPQSTCDFEVLITSGTVRLGIVNDNTVRKIIMRNSITLCTMKNRLKVGDEYFALREVGAGTRVRLMVCVSTRKFRLYINQTKEKTCDFPPVLLRSPNIYFYVELLQAGCVRILHK